MAVHPVGPHGLISRAEMERLELLTRAVHGLALATMPLMFLGAVVLTRRLDTPRRIAVLALALYGFALIALMGAATMSGFVAPSMLRAVVVGDALIETRRLFLDFTFRLNQGFAQVYAVGSCIAVALWSGVMVADRNFSRGLGAYGLIASLAILAALLGGHLALDVHGFGLVAFSQSIWFAIAGFVLRKPGDFQNAQVL